MQKYEVLKGFKHPHTKKVYAAGEIVELSPQAAIGLMGYVKKVEVTQQGDGSSKKSAQKKNR